MLNLKSAVALAAFAITAASQAAIYTFDDILEGAQENPPVNTPAKGRAFGMLDTDTNMFHITVEAQDFLAPITAAHIHKAAKGTNGGVQYFLSGSTGGTTYFSHDVIMITEADEAAFLSSLWYVNIHTQANPGGEIRGQLNPVPEPASMIALGLGAAALLRRRNRR